jgi:hypothetical protein
MLKFMRLHSGSRIIQRCGPLAWLAALLVTHLAAAATPVSVQLVLAVDVSGSVSEDRFELQRQGYAAAFRSADVQQAIRSTATGSIAVAMVQWTGPALHVVAVDWSLVADAASAERLAAAIEQAPRALFSGGTSISGAIDYAREMLARSPYSGQRLVIDVSGDGANNRGPPPEDARRRCAGWRGDQRAADPDAGAEPRHLLSPECDRWPGSLRHRGEKLRGIRRRRAQQAGHRDRHLGFWRTGGRCRSLKLPITTLIFSAASRPSPVKAKSDSAPDHRHRLQARFRRSLSEQYAAFSKCRNNDWLPAADRDRCQR